MENQKINVTVENGVKELVIRYGEAEPVVGLRKPISVNGNLNVPLNYLTNTPHWFANVDENNASPLQYSHLVVDRTLGSLKLIVDAGTEWEGCYTGNLAFSKDFLNFKINTGKAYSTFELSDFIKMNRSFFESKDVAMALVSDLRNFKSKIDKEVENMDDARGNKRVLIHQVVESNIPASFKLLMPIFKGYEPVLFEIEVAISATDFSCTLISPQVNDYINAVKDDLINEQLDEIKALYPNLKIFEI